MSLSRYGLTLATRVDLRLCWPRGLGFGGGEYLRFIALLIDRGFDGMRSSKLVWVDLSWYCKNLQSSLRLRNDSLANILAAKLLWWQWYDGFLNSLAIDILSRWLTDRRLAAILADMYTRLCGVWSEDLSALADYGLLYLLRLRRFFWLPVLLIILS